ncbi:anthranilate synthase component I family protein [Algoriphagus lacus]|uniref:Anthranilate synthase component I family protein n=1 Tax=Algoriphagus lacus TaxID=2056311 RepID=A0A418PN28_9BACT|nr:anthranilate synthase component I family protein [Algoriphagus lacus]RIW13143.1 anthranilate synthase component I family protein [Algoriphagus lacus]
MYSHSFSKAQDLIRLLRWADLKFEHFALFEGNGSDLPEGSFDSLFFAGNKKIDAISALSFEKGADRVGIIGYDFKNHIENLQSKNPEFFPLPELCFFEPEISFRITENGIWSKKPVPDQTLNEILNFPIPEEGNTSCEIYLQITREEYLQRIKKIQHEILEGNTYEANFCQAFYGKFESWDPISAFLKLNQLSPMPFAGLFKAGRQWLVSASPERYLKKIGDRLIAQPIKGTIRRGKTPEEDEINQKLLLASEKERAENLMITDLTRNDLSRVSKTGSVKVEELFGIYPLPGVFQMISTVSSELRPKIALKEIIHATFPMGSMTGAPKISTMNIIEREESFRRGWFSGAFGWIDELGDFDFSVVIRSIIADLDTKKLYFGVGSAITIDASAEQEYEECALKAQAILELLRGN